MRKVTFGVLATSAFLGLGTLAASADQYYGPGFWDSRAEFQSAAPEVYAQDYGYDYGYDSGDIHSGPHSVRQSTGAYAPNLELNQPNAGG